MKFSMHQLFGQTVNLSEERALWKNLENGKCMCGGGGGEDL